MAFPQVLSYNKEAFATPATSHSVTLPGDANVTAGDLLLLHFVNSGSATQTAPNGWTEIDQAGSASHRTGLYAKVAVGDEGSSVSVAISASEAAVAEVFQIGQWDGTIANIAEQGTTSLDPVSLTPAGGAADYLWLALTGAGDDDVLYNGFPTSYTDQQQIQSGAGGNAGCELASCRRELNASSEDPSAFSLESSESSITNTVAIPPGTSGGSPGGGGATGRGSLVGGKLVGGILVRQM